uniref:Caspase 8 associated protein 2 n=1 Tax=Oncorhynchus kisutch TaxID=8019 RepID=A0A8C7DJ66_ONCKI
QNLKYMDLYEEIITEEQQDRESSYNELVLPLTCLTCVFTLKNTTLNTENSRLKKNICALIKTAKMEVVRKDEEINRLSQSQLLCKDRDVVHPLLPPTPSDATVFRPPLPDTTVLRPPLLDATVLRPPLLDATVLRPPLPVTSKTAKGDSEAPVKRTVGSSSQDSVNRHPTRELHPSDEPKQTKHREGGGGNPRLSHSNDQRKYNSKSSRCPRLSDVEVRRRSERAKNPTSDILHCTASSDRTSEGLSKDCAAYQSMGSSRHYQELRRDKGDGNRHSRGTKDISSNRKHAYLNQASVTERSSESFNRKGGTSPPRDHRRKEERRREDEVRKEKNTSKKSGERKSTCTERRRAKESDRCSTDVSKDKTMDDSKVGGQKTGEKSEFLPSEAKVAAKSSVEETGPNRKLSFMETLNLTLSPVKKPRRLAETKEQEGTPPEEVPEDQSAEDSGQPDLDNLLILDEINSSVVETDEVFEDPVVQPSSEIPMSSGPGSIDLRHTDKEPCQDANKGLTEATVAKKQPKCQLEVEDIIVQGVSEGKPELPEATVDQRTEPTTPEPPREVCVSAPVCAIVLRTTLKNRPEDCASANKVSDSEDFTAAAVTATTVAGNCGNNSNTDTGLSSNGFTPDHSMENVVLITDNWVCKPNGKTPSALVCESQTVTQVPPAAVCVGHPAVEGVSGKEPSESLQLPLPASVISTSSLDVTAEVQDISKHGVSSTISMEVIPEICITSEIVEDATEIPLECEKERTVVVQGSPLSGFEVSKVSSTTGEVAPSAQHNSGLSQTPKKSLDSEPSHTENEDVNVEPSSSIPLAHDEDSMMLTLGSLKGIPDAISPLTSPVRPMRKSHQPPCHSKPAYVKSLRKEFTSAAGDPNPKKLDVNMENKNPGRSIASATQQDVDRASVCSSSPEDELEEGEILSEGEETPITPSSPAKTVRPTSTVKSQQIPKSSPRLSKKLPEEKGISKLLSKTLTSPVGSPMSKARYKTVQPPLPKAALCTVEEVMAMFVKIRYACRKKYMKLRSTFSKERFCGVMDMSLDSFTDFVDSVSFTKLCSQEDDLKVKLKNNIMSVLSKLSNNGIVNRIFDQEPLNMKSKLWEFVNVQLDFLFKEIQTALRSVCKSSNGNQSAGAEKRDLSLSKQPVKSPKPPVKSPKGKNIKMSFEEDKESEPQTSDHPLMQPPMQPPLQHGLEILSSNSPSSAEKTAAYVRRLSQNGSLHDKSDFEILTEQQASNLTFNLVTDSQMGEIFKCLLQGSDLLETSVSAGDNQGWPLGTPRKGERFRGVTTPSKVGTTTKVGTPSKVIATWSSISPCKFSSPNSKVQIPLNPALLDESCMLEVPSSLPEDKMTSQSSVFSQRSYSILAEDLAVSLTIPSPLKSDNHLSFLHPANVEPTSAPDSVISAHFSEDALMDGEDATEQDIHLALDTDNSSGGSSGAGRTREAPVNPLFHFKPHLPMQAVVMEKSNDHFIVRIRHANTSPDINSNNSGVNFTNLGINFSNLGNNSTSLVVNPTCLGIKSTSQGVNSSSPGSVNSTYPGNNSTNPDTNSSYPCVNSTSPQVNCTNPGIYPISADINPRAVSSPQTPPGGEQHGKDQAHPTGKTPSKTHFSEASPPFYLSTSTETASALSSPCLTIIEDTPERDHSKGKTGKKRTRHHVEMKAKRPKKEVIPEKIIKHKKKSSKRAKGKETRSSKSERSKVTTPPQSTPSPNSLSAKNIIIKKGAVVVTWTRDEDRDILLALKMKGASPDTFSSLSEKMNKTPAQVCLYLICCVLI